MLDVCLPGTGGMLPMENRWLSCCWIEYQGSAILIDCGEGTQLALKKAGCRLNRLETLLITHYHADHIAGLPGLLLTLGNHGKTTPLLMIGPEGLRQVVSALTVISPNLSYPIALLEHRGDSEGKWEQGEMTLSWLPLCHGVTCLGYRVSLKRKPVFNPQKAEALSVPKNLYHVLHSGSTISLSDGRTITPEMVTDGSRKPLTVCYFTDTLPTDRMAAFAERADLLISEGMYGDEAMHQKMEEKGHMTFSDSARIAREAGVKRLWLTHYSPALTDPEPYMEVVRQTFFNTTAAHDGIRLTLGKKETFV